MKTITNNTAAILSELSGVIQHLNASDLIYPKGTIAPSFIAPLGIRSLVKNAPQGSFAYSFQYAATTDWQNTSNYQWSSFKKEPIIEDLQTLFTNCQIMSFADWSDIYGATDLWDGLLRDVIKPLRKKNFEFVFYLGNPAKKSAFEVDEILDIIGDYSLYGLVTLVLDEGEADKLWLVLNGYDPNKSLSPLLLCSPEERNLSIFNTVNINHLLINFTDHILSISRQGRFELVYKVHDNASIANYAKNNFNAGYSLGLQLQLELSQCAALGLAVSGSYRENGICPDRSALLLYIKKWMAEGVLHLLSVP